MAQSPALGRSVRRKRFSSGHLSCALFPTTKLGQRWGFSLALCARLEANEGRVGGKESRPDGLSELTGVSSKLLDPVSTSRWRLRWRNRFRRFLPFIVIVLSLNYQGVSHAQRERSSIEAEVEIAVGVDPRTDRRMDMARRAQWVRQVMVLGPVLKGRPEPWRTRLAMKKDYLRGEAQAHPHSGDRVGSQVWEVQVASDDLIDLDRFLSDDAAVAYVFLSYYCERAQEGVLFLGSDGPLRAYFDGQRVYTYEGTRVAKIDQAKVNLSLARGAHRLLLKVARGERFRLSIRLGGKEKGPLPEVSQVPLPVPPAVGSYNPLIVAPGGRLEVRVPYEVDGGAGAALSVKAERLPGFASIKPDRTGVTVSLSPGKGQQGVYRAALRIARGPAVTVVPLLIHVGLSAALDVTPAFNAVVGGRYPLRLLDRVDGREYLELAALASWRSSCSEVGVVEPGGTFRAISTGSTRLEAEYGGLTWVIPVEVGLRVGAHSYERRVTVLKTLVAIYSPPTCKQCAEKARNAVENAREFYYRNTLGRLALEVTYLTAEGSIPRIRGSYWRGLEHDLKSRGVGELDYGLIVGLGPSEGPCYGGGSILGSAAMYCSMLRMTYVVHEIQHALDRVIATRSDLPEMIYGHGYTDAQAFGVPTYPVTAGRGADWEAAILRDFDAYDRFIAPWDHFMSVIDSDGDGLADRDPRLPVDEWRLKTDPLRPDSDGDGLADFSEYTAGIYGGSDPNHPDTDGDGRVDGEDRYPLYRLREPAGIPYASQPLTIDGVLEDAWPLLTEGVNKTGQCLNGTTGCRSVGSPALYAAWDEEFLYLAVTSSKPVRGLLMNVDGSAEDGPWLGGDLYVLWADKAASSLKRSTGVYLASERKNGREVSGARVAMATDRRGGVLEVAIPAALGEGYGWDALFLGAPLKSRLTLESGHQIRLALQIETGGAFVTFFEEQVFIPLELEAPLR